MLDKHSCLRAQDPEMDVLFNQNILMQNMQALRGNQDIDIAMQNHSFMGGVRDDELTLPCAFSLQATSDDVYSEHQANLQQGSFSSNSLPNFVQETNSCAIADANTYASAEQVNVSSQLNFFQASQAEVAHLTNQNHSHEQYSQAHEVYASSSNQDELYSQAKEDLNEYSLVQAKSNQEDNQDNNIDSALVLAEDSSKKQQSFFKKVTISLFGKNKQQNQARGKQDALNFKEQDADVIDNNRVDLSDSEEAITVSEQEQDLNLISFASLGEEKSAQANLDSFAYDAKETKHIVADENSYTSDLSASSYAIDSGASVNLGELVDSEEYEVSSELRADVWESTSGDAVSYSFQQDEVNIIELSKDDYELEQNKNQPILEVDEDTKRKAKLYEEREDAKDRVFVDFNQNKPSKPQFSLIEHTSTLQTLDTLEVNDEAKAEENSIENSLDILSEEDADLNAEEEDFVAGNVTTVQENQCTGTDHAVVSASRALASRNDHAIESESEQSQYEVVTILPDKDKFASTYQGFSQYSEDKAKLLPQILQDFMVHWYTYGLAVLLCVLCLFKVYQVQETRDLTARLNEVALLNVELEKQWLNLMADRQNLSEHVKIRSYASSTLNMVSPKTENEKVISSAVR